MPQQSQAPQQPMKFIPLALGDLVLLISFFAPWARVTSAISPSPQYLSPWNLLTSHDIFALLVAGYLGLVTLLEVFASGFLFANPERQLRKRLLWLSALASVMFFPVFLPLLVYLAIGGLFLGDMSWPFYHVSLDYGVGTEVLGMLLVSGSLILFRG